MTDDSFHTVAGRGEAIVTVRGSRFHAQVAPAGSPEEADAFIETVRTEDPDATHHVPAYRVRVHSGDGGVFLREYQSDDGEPGGSAGPPALNVLQGQDLENVVVVVTRHYGGTNLGVGGLASAYSDAVAAAIADTSVVTDRPHVTVSITVDYDDSGTVRRRLESDGLDFHADYEERVTFTVEVPRSTADSVIDGIRSATSDRATIDVSGFRSETL
ncbi:MAG: YigZ family protein [Halobacteriaceae archaeon]